MGGWRVAPILALLVIAGCGSSTIKNTAKPLPTALPECRAGVALRDLPVFVIGISNQGRVCWETPLTQPQPNSHTSAQPLIADGMAFLDTDGVVFGVDLADGHQRWRWSSGSPPPTGSGGGGNQMLSAADARVVATGQQGKRREVVGLDEAKGSVRWRYTEPAGYLSLVATNDGGVALSSASGTVTQVISDQDGRKRWSQAATPPPQVAGGALIQVTPGPTPFGNDLLENVQGGGVKALRATNGEMAWTYSGKVNQVQAAGSLLFLTPPPDQTPGQYDVDTTAIDPSNGRPMWTLGPLDPGGSMFYEARGALLHAEIGSQAGTFARLDPATGHESWQVSAQVYTVTAVDHELVDLETAGYQQGTEMIVARDPSTGAVRWQTPLSGPTIGGVVGGDVFRVKLYALSGRARKTLVDVAGTDVTGLDPATGKTRWNITLPNQTTVDGIATAGNGIVMQISGLSYAIGGH